jgi:murein endopeptidase
MKNCKNLTVIFSGFFLLQSLILGSLSVAGAKGVKKSSKEEVSFCSIWNPDFKKVCCAPVQKKKRKSCDLTRRTQDFCSEITEAQLKYTKLIESGGYSDLIGYLKNHGNDSQQAYCDTNNGFLAYGRRVLATPVNRLQFFFPGRCTNFGTDEMAGMLEWVGQEIAKKYSAPSEQGVKLTIADITAPRGGCIWGLSGRSAHRSHTNGLDVDIGFLTVVKHRQSPAHLHTSFDSKANWWLVKRIFENPFACIKYLFLDGRLISKIKNVARTDSKWKEIRPYILDARGHHNHMHIRIGNSRGKAGCPALGAPDEESDDSDEDSD